jgi:hypothetical protein
METSLRSDPRQWGNAIIGHWKSIAGGSGAGVMFLIASLWVGGYWLRILGFVTLLVSFVYATFLVWRDEHRKTIGKQRRSILNNVVDLPEPKIMVLGETRPDEICGLIAMSDQFGSEEDVVWVCNQLNDHGHVDPFGILGAMFKPDLMVSVSNFFKMRGFARRRFAR